MSTPGAVSGREVVVTGCVVLDLAGFNPAEYIAQARRLRSMHRTFQLGTAAAVAAWRAAGLNAAGDAPTANPERVGVAAAVADLSPYTPDLLRLVESSPTPDWSAFAERALHQLHPFRRLALLANMAAAHTSLLLNLQGPSFTFTSGADSGAQAVREACLAIERGDADLMLCHQAESPEQVFAAFPGPEFAAAAVVESAVHARRRGARVWTTLPAPPLGHGSLPGLITSWRAAMAAAVEESA